MSPRPFPAAFLLSAGILCAPALRAGKLGDVEREAKRRDTVETTTVESSDADDGSFWDFMDMTFSLLKAGGQESWSRVHPEAGSFIQARDPGSPSLPFARADVHVQDVRSDVRAVDFRSEAGYGPLGVQFRRTRYEEEDPEDLLYISHVHGLYRMSATHFFQADLGAGAVTLKGGENLSGVSFTTPVHLFPTESFALDYRPTWSWIAGAPIEDHDLGLSWVLGPVSLRAGYRWVGVGNARLDGPYAGLSVHL